MNRLICAVALLLCALLPVDARAQAAPRRLGFLEIPDLRTTLAQVETMAAAVAPGTLPPGALAAGLAAKLGDPGLAGLGEGPALVMFLAPSAPMGAPGTAVFVPVVQAAPYEKAMVAMGWKTRRAGSVLLGGSTPEALAAAAEETDYRSLAGRAAGRDAHLMLDVALLMETYGPLLQLGMEAAGAKLAAAPPSEGKPATAPPPAAVAKLLQLEMKGLLLLLKQTAELRLDVDFQPDAVATDLRVAAVEGSALADLANQEPPRANGSAALLSRAGFMTATYQMDGPRVAAFVASLVREMSADPQGAGLVSPALVALVEQWGRAFTGEAAVTMGEGSTSPLVAETVMKVSDEAAALEVMDKSAALFAPGGAWHALYSDMGVGMHMAVQKNVRRHAGVPVHRFKMAVDAAAKAVSEDQKALHAMMARDMEFAVVRGYLVSTQDAAALDAVIDRALAARARPAPVLHAAQAFGEGRHAYLDYDVFGLLRAVVGAMPRDKGSAIPFAALPPTAAPLMYGVSFVDGQVRVETKVPLSPFAQMAETFKKAAPAKVTPPPQ
jgi:hypothetical protein